MSASAHWYDIEGNSAHTVIGKNGKERATNIKDAREKKLFPSVTTILGIFSKPALDYWKNEQVALAAGRLITSGEVVTDQPDYVAKVVEEAFKQVEDAADLGTQIHLAIEQWQTGQAYDPAMKVYVDAVEKWLKENQVTIKESELRLVNKFAGYAGTTDAAIECPKGFGILDFKSRKTTPGKKVEAYDDQIIQIAAYLEAKYHTFLGSCGVNLFISTTEPGRVEAVWYDQIALIDAYEAFASSAFLWRYLKGYDPRQL
jgi:hypothetical protein